MFLDTDFKKPIALSHTQLIRGKLRANTAVSPVLENEPK